MSLQLIWIDHLNHNMSNNGRLKYYNIDVFWDILPSAKCIESENRDIYIKLFKGSIVLSPH